MRTASSAPVGVTVPTSTVLTALTSAPTGVTVPARVRRAARTRAPVGVTVPVRICVAARTSVPAGVTVNKGAGQITTAADALAAGATVELLSLG